MSNLLLLAAVALPVLLLLGIVLGWRYVADRDRRRSPLNFKLLNSAGDGLRHEIDRQDDKMDEAGMSALVIGPITLSAWLLSKVDRIPGGISWSPWDWMFVVLGLGGTLWAACTFIRHGKLRRRYRQALAAERATAQNLAPLMAEGCMVFHDFPADRFNIDHIVVAPHAVYAVETKSRRKPSTGGKAAARVVYDGRALRFPTHVETKPVEQAKAQAEWLRRFLTAAIGEPVGVVPVLSLPGWYVDLSREGSRADVVVANLRNPLFLLKLGAGAKADPIRQKRIAHALAERYPSLEN